MQLHPMSDDIELKFRHVSGDIGPLKVSGSSNILQVKEKLYAQWPKGKPLHNPLLITECLANAFSRMRQMLFEEALGWGLHRGSYCLTRSWELWKEERGAPVLQQEIVMSNNVSGVCRWTCEHRQADCGPRLETNTGRKVHREL